MSWDKVSKAKLDGEKGNNSSWIWKSIIEERKILRKYERWSIGRGDSVDICKDRWVLGYNHEVLLKTERVSKKVSEKSYLESTPDGVDKNQCRCCLLEGIWLWVSCNCLQGQQWPSSNCQLQYSKILISFGSRGSFSQGSCNYGKQFNMDRVIFESDCQNLIQALKSNTTISEVDAFLEDIRELAKNIPEMGFIWVPRKVNRVAHEIAKLAAASPLCSASISNLPASITELILSEANRVEDRRRRNC
ncbi:hypothetical protein PIB30_058354 [Stylosanthes scabra]|uniref:RNase H type-1 domain-containing protein n=1 Tax=Stylosanthes scabra TaxID=79078 RepID=A0ABU6RKQ1_9FABA|nr:hypothetical protein [Stylosanthes scabra]